MVWWWVGDGGESGDKGGDGEGVASKDDDGEPIAAESGRGAGISPQRPEVGQSRRAVRLRTWNSRCAGVQVCRCTGVRKC